MIEPQSAQDGESAETLKLTLAPPPSSMGAGLYAGASSEWPLLSEWPFEREWTGRSVPPTDSAGGGSAATADALGPPASPTTTLSASWLEGALGISVEGAKLIADEELMIPRASRSSLDRKREPIQRNT